MKKLLQFNPYIVGNPIKSRDMFFGREDDFAYVAKKIGENRSNQIMVLCGERRSGKTSILFQILGGRLGEAFLPVLIDMQMLAGIKGDAEFFRAILKVGCALLCRDGLTVEALEASAGGQGVEWLFEAFLGQVQERAPGKIVLFLLDEYELIEAKIRDGSLSESTIHYLTGILESPYRVSFIFTGSTNLEDRGGEIWKALLGKSLYRKISYLSRGDTARLITEPVRESVTWPPELVDAIFRLTGGHPFYTQVICQNMVDLLMEEQRDDPQPADLERIVRDIVDNPLPQMIYSWNSLAEWNQVILSSIANGLPNPHAWSPSSVVYRFLLGNRIVLPFKKERINVLLEEAYHREILEKDEQGAYRYRMDLLRRWISREHSIWKVAREAGLEFKKGGRPLVLAASIVLPVLALAAAGWFVIVPRFFPSLLGQAGPAAAASAAEDVKNITFTANRGPFILQIDGGSALTSERQADPKSILIPSLAPGKHTFVAAPREGASVSREIDVGSDGQIFSIAFAAVAQAPRGQTAAGSSGTGAAAGAPEATVTREPAEAPAPPAQDTASEAAVGPAAPVTPAAEEIQVGELVVSSKPPDALVTLDGIVTGKPTPYLEKVPAGEHTIVLSLEGYKRAEVRITVEPGQQIRREITLEDAWAEITFDVRPSAGIYIDGVHVLDTPLAKPFQVRAGKHTVTIKNEALKVDEAIAVTLVEGQELKISRVLTKAAE